MSEWFKVLKNWLRVLFTSLILLQSIAVVADSHQSHQSGVDHVTFDDHSHADDADLNHLDSPNDLDCHHCCHCHSAVGSVMVSRYTLLSLASSNQAVYVPYVFKFTSEPQASLFRPPIV